MLPQAAGSAGCAPSSPLLPMAWQGPALCLLCVWGGRTSPHLSAASPLLADYPGAPPLVCRALVRLVAWRRSGSRLVLHGGCGNLEQEAEAGRGAPPGVGQGRPQEVFGAFAAFRQNRCHPEEVGATDEAFPARGSGGTASGKQTAKAGSKAPQAGLSPPTALPERLIYAAELLHILRPLVYALALRR